MIHTFFQIVFMIKDNSRSIFVSWQNYNWCIILQFFQSFALILGRVSFKGLEIWSVRLILARIMSASSFLRSFTTSSLIVMISFLGSVLEIIYKLRSFAIMLIALCVTFFLLISLSSFNVCLYLSLCQIKTFLIQILMNLFYKMEFLKFYRL